jgi:hypothetical protein
MLEVLPAGLGWVLSGVRAGLDNLVFHHDGLADVPATIEVTSSAFGDGDELPVRFTVDGDGISPPLCWRGVPSNAREVVLLIEDADSPTPYPLVHSIVWRLPAGDGSLNEGAMPAVADFGTKPAMGVNSYLRIGYLAPDPPPGHGPHNYAFQIFALAAPLMLDTAAPGRTELLDALHVHALAKGLLIGTYERK